MMEKRSPLHALLYGWIVIFGLIFVMSLLLAGVLRFTSLDAESLSWVTLSAGCIILFTGGLIAGMKGKVRGWLIGGVIALGFSLFTFLVQYLGFQEGFSTVQMMHHGLYLLAAVLGGVIGVNRIFAKSH